MLAKVKNALLNPFFSCTRTGKKQLHIKNCFDTSFLILYICRTAAGIEMKLAKLAARRQLSDLTIGPVLTVTTKRMLDHVDALLKIPGARLVFGGKELSKIDIQF